jgi:hypothetical protein
MMLPPRASRACTSFCLKAFVLAALPFAALPLAAQTAPAAVTLTGSVLDPSGAAIPQAAVHLHSDAADQAAVTDITGHFSLRVFPGTYTVTVEAAGFRDYSRPSFIAPLRNAPLNITLKIATATEEINVPSDPGLSNDADANKTALVFKGDQLDTFSDDPAIMQQQLLALGGSDPTNPPQLYVDGFSNGTLPPKESIREIRINQNPFSAQYDQFGSGRIEIFTKPGANKLHGTVQGNYGDNVLNARNPYAGAQPPYNNDYLNGNVNGPIGKHSSFFLSGQRSDLSQNAIINAVTLDPSLNPLTLSQAIANKAISQTYSLRLDHQFGATDTFIGRYTYSENSQPNSGIGSLVLASQATAVSGRTQTLQLTDTHIFGPHVILDSGFQYIRTRTRSDAISTAPALVVQGSFSGGGSPSQALHDNLDRIELQQYLSISHAAHFIRTGLRFRMTRDANLATAGYNGQFVFPDLTTYRNTLADIQGGLSGQAIRAKGDGPSQFSLSSGTPSASLSTGDIGLYAEDEWKRTANFTLNYGVRFESQTAIPDHFDFAPRVGFAYSIKRNPKAKDPVLVVRGGFGIFYQRFASSNILQSLRQNGTTQQVYLVTNPQLNCDPAQNKPCSLTDLSSMPTLTATPTTVYQISPHLRSPVQMQGMVSAEHSFGKYGSLSASYFQRRSTHQFESLNINAPLPGTYDPTKSGSGIRPLGGTQNIYQFSSDGIGNGHTFGVNPNLNFGKKLSIWAFAVVGHQESDTNGAGSFASNSYNVGADAGTISGFSPRQLYSGINARPGWDTAINVFFGARSTTNFNITTGLDNNGDTIYNDRPAFATDLTRASVVKTAYGNFDTNPLPGQTIIPINYGRAPGMVYTEIYFNKNFRFGPRPPAPPPPPATAAAPGTTPAAPAPKTPPGPVKKADLPPPRYRLEFGFGADNVFNHVNPGPPVGVLSSPLFGHSISLNSGFSNNTAANRAITLRTAFSF